jgi:hypothetical protein
MFCFLDGTTNCRNCRRNRKKKPGIPETASPLSWFAWTWRSKTDSTVQTERWQVTLAQHMDASDHGWCQHADHLWPLTIFDHLWPSQHFTTMDISASCKTGTACKLQKAAWLHAKFVYMSKVGTNDTWLNELSYLCQQRHALMNHSHGTSSGKFRNNRFFWYFFW